MAYSDLRDFIRALEKKGELKRIPFEVDPYLEITEFADRSVKSNGPALLFEKPKGSYVPVLINAFASDAPHGDRARSGFGRRGRRAASPNSWKCACPKASSASSRCCRSWRRWARSSPRSFPAAPCKDVIRQATSSRSIDFPILHCWPGDGGRFITLPMVFSQESRHRQAQLRHVPHASLRRAAPPACTGRRTSRAPNITAASSPKARQAQMDVAVAIGADPATMYSAILPLPPDLDEMMIAGFLRAKPVEMVKCETCRSRSARQRRDRSRRLRRTRRDCAAKAPSATTPASIRSKTITRSSTSPASRIARIPSTPPPSSARRRWRISTWARRSSASFCR